MSSTLLELTRIYNEDIDQYEDACAELLLEEAKTYRDNLIQSYRVNEYVERIGERHEKLVEIYLDVDSRRKYDLSSFEGDPTSIQLFSQFYDKVKEIKEYHLKHASVENKAHEARIMLEERETAKSKAIASFSSEEGYGRYVDLHNIHFKFSNLKGLVDTPYYVDYMGFLDEMINGIPAVPSSTRKNPEYLQILQELVNYLSDFLKRSLPLFVVDEKLLEATRVFQENWKAETFRPISMGHMKISHTKRNDGMMETEEEEEDDKDWVVLWRLKLEEKKKEEEFYCPCCSMKLSKDTVWKSHIGSGKHLKAKQKYMAHVEAVSQREAQLMCLNELVHTNIVATKENIEKKQARLPGEAGYVHHNRHASTTTTSEMDDEINFDSDDDDDNSEEDNRRTRLTKKNYPIGPDGNPLPYWLYRLQGLSHEFKCEICGNASYFGRRAFERHFSDSKHTHGLRCLGLDNVKEMFEITEIDKALALGKKLKALKTQGKWIPEVMEEFEDAEGTVMDKATYDLLAKQFGGV